MDQTPQPTSPEVATVLQDKAIEQELDEKFKANADKKFPIIEIFGPVIQGEGSQAGQQTMFVRFGGCDFRCKKCDSLHAVIPEAIAKHRTMMSAEDIAKALVQRQKETGVDWVTFSGGNPCMHKLGFLVQILQACGYRVNVETQGTLSPNWLYMCDLITVSPKSPGMGEKFPQAQYVAFLTKFTAFKPLCVKVVIFSAQDLEFALHVKGITDFALSSWPPGFIAYYLSLGNPYPPVLNEELDLVENPALTEMSQSSELSPKKAQIIGLLADYKAMSEEILPDPRLKGWRFLPQLHVLVYGNETGR